MLIVKSGLVQVLDLVVSSGRHAVLLRNWFHEGVAAVVKQCERDHRTGLHLVLDSRLVRFLCNVRLCNREYQIRF